VLVDDRARSNPFLFEHNWRRRPIRSFFATWFASLRPRRFWNHVALHETPRVRPLVALVLIVAVLSFAIFLGLVNAGAWATSGYTLPQWLPSTGLDSALSSLHWFLQGIRDPRDWLDPETGGALLWFAGVQVAGTWVFLAALRQTLGRCRVRAVQLLRVVAYATIGTSLLMLPTVLVLFWVVGEAFPWGRWYGTLGLLALLLPLFVPCLMFGYFVTVGLRDYVKLPRPWALGLTASFTASLAALAVFATFVFFVRP